MRRKIGVVVILRIVILSGIFPIAIVLALGCGRAARGARIARMHTLLKIDFRFLIVVTGVSLRLAGTRSGARRCHPVFARGSRRDRRDIVGARRTRATIGVSSAAFRRRRFSGAIAERVGRPRRSSRSAALR
jgi:hypothetical protein